MNVRVAEFRQKMKKHQLYQWQQTAYNLRVCFYVEVFCKNKRHFYQQTDRQRTGNYSWLCLNVFNRWGDWNHKHSICYIQAMLKNKLNASVYLSSSQNGLLNVSVKHINSCLLKWFYRRWLLSRTSVYKACTETEFIWAV